MFRPLKFLPAIVIIRMHGAKYSFIPDSGPFTGLSSQVKMAKCQRVTEDRGNASSHTAKKSTETNR